MKFYINQKYMDNCLSVMLRGVNSQTPLNVLECIQITVTENYIQLVTSDITTLIRKECVPTEENQIEILETGVSVVNAKYLYEIIHKQQENEKICISTTSENSLIEIQTKKGVFHLNGMNQTDYPMLDSEKAEETFEISRNNIEDIVSQVAYACSMDDRRPALTGVHLQTKNSTLLVMASDSYRLAMKKIELNQMVNMDVIVPKKAFVDILKCTNTTTEKIQACYDTHKIQFYFDDTLIQTTLINGTFPNVQRIVPKEFECKLKTTVDTILPIIDRSQFIKDESKVHIVKVAMTNHDVHIKSKSSIIGNTDETLPNVELEGSPLNLSFNGKYLYEAIKGVQGDEQQLLLQFGGEYNPLLVTNPLDRSVCAICVPLRTYE